MRPGMRMRNRRVELGQSLSDAASQLELSAQYLSALELGKNRPPAWDILLKMAEVYQCTTDYLLGLNWSTSNSPSGASEEILMLFSRMGKHRQAEVLAIARTLYELDLASLQEKKEREFSVKGGVTLNDVYERLEVVGYADLLTDVALALVRQDDTAIDKMLGVE